MILEIDANLIAAVTTAAVAIIGAIGGAAVMIINAINRRSEMASQERQAIAHDIRSEVRSTPTPPSAPPAG